MVTSTHTLCNVTNLSLALVVKSVGFAKIVAGAKKAIDEIHRHVSRASWGFNKHGQGIR